MSKNSYISGNIKILSVLIHFKDAILFVFKYLTVKELPLTNGYSKHFYYETNTYSFI